MPDTPRKLLGWRAWLAERPDARDLQVVDSRRTRFGDLAHVQVIVLYRVDGTRHLMCGVDFYWLIGAPCTSYDACFACGDDFPVDAPVVVEGKLIRDDVYADLQHRAMESRVF